ncbi:MAG: transposase [Kiritimatiellia bacterium]
MHNWPHAPPHRLTEAGAYMVTAGTYRKAHWLSNSARLDFFLDLLFACADESGWTLHAWAALSNHYHFVASSPGDPASLKKVLSKLHALSAREFNAQDRTPGRKVWFQFFDTHVTFPESYFARLKYVHGNPAHHGVVLHAENYPWCSAHWFARTANAAFRKTVESFKTDRINVLDPFEPVPVQTEESGVKPPQAKAVSSHRTPDSAPPDTAG